MSVIDSFLANSSITIEAEGIAPLTIGLDPNSPASPLTKLLKPKVTVKNGNSVLYQSAPYGNPSGVPWLYIVGGIVGLIVVMTLVRGR